MKLSAGVSKLYNFLSAATQTVISSPRNLWKFFSNKSFKKFMKLSAGVSKLYNFLSAAKGTISS